jgi:hypothetical protein
MTQELKICTRCKVKKPLSEYHLRSKREGIPKSACKDCHRERARGYWRKNPLPKEVQRARNLQKSFGITLEEYEDMLLSQECSCKICKRHHTTFSRNLCVDHCHTTGKIRGLLCNNCNSGLGKYEDNISFLEAAITYLKEYKHGE